MVILNKYQSYRRVQVQVKDPITGESKSLTIYYTTVNDIFPRICAFLTALENSPEENIKIVARKWKEKPEIYPIIES